MPYTEIVEVLKVLANAVCQEHALEAVPTRPGVWRNISKASGREVGLRAGYRSDLIALHNLLYRSLRKNSSIDQLANLLKKNPKLDHRMFCDSFGTRVSDVNITQEFTRLFFAVPILKQYFADKRSFVLDTDLFDKIADKEIQRILTDGRKVIYTYPLSSMKMEGELLEIAEGLCIRQLTPDELEEWKTPSSLSNPFPFNYGAPAFSTAVEHIVEVPEDVPDLPDPDPVWTIKNTIVAILRLLFDKEVLTSYTKVESIGGFACTQGSRMYLPTSQRLFGPEVLLTEQLQKDFLAFWKAIHSGINAELVSLALSRLSMTFERSNDIDKILDSWIGLERLFCNDGTEGITLRAALRISALLGKTGAERESIFQEMKASYSLRSSIVHGSEVRDKENYTINQIAVLTQKYLRNAIIAILGIEENFKKALKDNFLELQLLRRDL